jgi:hypothetical protein
MLTINHCPLFIVRGIDRLRTQFQRSRNTPISSQGDSSCLHDAISMTVSRKNCSDVASNAVTLQRWMEWPSFVSPQMCVRLLPSSQTRRLVRSLSPPDVERFHLPCLRGYGLAVMHNIDCFGFHASISSVPKTKFSPTKTPQPQPRLAKQPSRHPT